MRDLPMDVLVLAAVAVALAVALLMFRGWRVRQTGRRRLYESESPGGDGGRKPAVDGRLGRWLALAGYTHPGAPMLFLLASVAALALGWLLGETYRRTLLGPLVNQVSGIPGGIGETFSGILTLGPWILFVAASLVPTLVVRAARRARVRAVNEDFPLTLELFATMAEAGLGFDAALSRIVQSQDRERPLVSELAAFQGDLLAGVPRVQAFRRLAHRVDLSALHAFTSAVIQAEQVGASIADTLRHQAEDMRNRRREGALLLAQALPVKLMFPLVICFLPGIFVSTLAPVIYQMIQVADSVIRSSGR